MTTEQAAHYLTASEAALHLGVSRRTFFVHVRKYIPHVQIGALVRFKPADLDAWAASQKVAPIKEATPPKALAERPPVGLLDAFAQQHENLRQTNRRLQEARDELKKLKEAKRKGKR